MSAETFPAYPPHKSSSGEDVKLRVHKAQFGDGYKQLTPDGINTKVITWTLQWDAEDWDKVVEMKEFIDDHAGATPFKWTPPGGSEALWTCEGYGGLPVVVDMSANLRCVFERYYGPEPS
jgi:phage-related protein